MAPAAKSNNSAATSTSTPTPTSTTTYVPPTGIAITAAVIANRVGTPLENLPATPPFTNGPGEFTGLGDNSNSINYAHAAPGPCTPFSGAPWLADEGASDLVNYAGSMTVGSDVVIMPTASDAQAAISAVNAPSYGSRCLEPGLDGTTKSALSHLPTSCDLSFVNSRISQLSSNAQGVAITGYHYVANVKCSKTGQTTPFFTDVVDGQAGAIVVQVRINTFGDPPPMSLDDTVMAYLVGYANLCETPSLSATSCV